MDIWNIGRDQSGINSTSSDSNRLQDLEKIKKIRLRRNFLENYMSILVMYKIYSYNNTRSNVVF